MVIRHLQNLSFKHYVNTGTIIQMKYRRVIQCSIFYWLCLHIVTVSAALSHNTSTVKRTDIEKDHLIPVSESEYFIHKDYEGSGTAEDSVIIEETPVFKILKKVSKSQQIDRTLKPYSTVTTSDDLSHARSSEKQNSEETINHHISIGETRKEKHPRKEKQTEEETERKPIVVLQQTPTAVIVILVILIILLICTSATIGYLVIKIKRMRKMAAQQPKGNGELEDDEYSVMMDWGTD